MSNPTKIAEEIGKIQSVLSVWEEHNALSCIEKDLLLDKLRTIYECVLLAETKSPLTGCETAASEVSISVKAETASQENLSYLSEVLPERQELAVETLPETEPVSSDSLVDSTYATELPAETLPTGNVVQPSEQKLFRDEPMVRSRVDKQVILSLYGDQPVASAPGSGRTDVRTQAGPDTAFPSDIVPSEDTEYIPQPEQDVPIISEQANILDTPEQFEEQEIVEVNVITEQPVEIDESLATPAVHVHTFQAPLVDAPGSRKVLGEVIPAAGQALNDVVGQQTNQADVASRLRSGSVRELRQGIGVNDRFQLINDLFGGDSGAYEQTLTHLDTFTSLDDAMIYIQENFGWNPDGDAAGMLVDLLQRKLES